MIQIIQEVLNDKTKRMEFNKTHHQNAFEIIPSAKDRTYEDICNGEDAIFLSVKILPEEVGTTSYNIVTDKNFAAARSYVHRTLAKQRSTIAELSVSCIEDARIVNEEMGIVVDAVIRLKDSEEQFLPPYMIEMLESEISIAIDGSNTSDNVLSESKNNVMSGETRKKDAGIENKKEFKETDGRQNLYNTSVFGGFNEDGIAGNADIDKYEPVKSLEKEPKLSPFSSKSVFDYLNDDEDEELLNEPAPDGRTNENSRETVILPDTTNAAQPQSTNPHYESAYKFETNHALSSDAEPNDENLSGSTFVKRDANVAIHTEIHTEKQEPQEFNPHKESASVMQKNAYENASLEMPFLNSIDEYIPYSDIAKLVGPCPMYEIKEEDADVRTTLSKETIKESFAQVLRYFTENERTLVNRVMKGELPPEKLMNEIRAYVDRMLNIPAEDMPMFMNKFERAFFSYYVLTPAINDPKVSDIRVLAPDNINVKVDGSHYTVKGLSFANAGDYFRYISMLLTRNYINEDGIPIKVFTDKDYHPDYRLRFNVCLPSINTTDMPYLHIRKVNKNKKTLDDLMAAGMLDSKIAKYLLDKVINSRGIVFAGPSASGKTTLMNALIDYIPKEKSILCIQESEELFSDVHPNAYFQHMLKNDRGQIVLGLSELGQNGLLCDSGVFIIGESKGAEVRDLLRASNTGHQCWTSVHSQNTRETIPRLADYVKYGSDYSFTEATRMLKDLEVIIYIQNFRITEISEIAGYDDVNEKIIYRAIYNRALDKK